MDEYSSVDTYLKQERWQIREKLLARKQSDVVCFCFRYNILYSYLVVYYKILIWSIGVRNWPNVRQRVFFLATFLIFLASQKTFYPQLLPAWGNFNEPPYIIFFLMNAGISKSSSGGFGSSCFGVAGGVCGRVVVGGV